LIADLLRVTTVDILISAINITCEIATTLIARLFA
jgi:hypothetical protein